MNKNQRGFAHILLVIILLVVIAVVFLAWNFTKNKSSSSNNNSQQSQITDKSPKIKNIGINLDDFDSSTNTAGDIKFEKFDTESGGLDAIFSEYGRAAPDNNTVGAGRLNPQPTFIAPLGTKVHALVDGTVVDVPKLYSGDYSVHMQADGDDELIFETEHVINVLVKAGDKVKAGDVIAEVSDYDSKNLNGLGLFEIGILKGGNPPSHVCPFSYLDDSIKEATLKKITALEDAWETFVGDSNVYNQANESVPGCATLDPIEG